MIEQLTSFIQQTIVGYGAFGVLLATLLEEIIAPIPSALVPLAAGFFLLPAHGNFIEITYQALFVVALPVALGITMGSLAIYGIGYWGGKPVIEKNEKWLGINWKDLERTQNKLTRGKGDEVILFILRVIPVIPGVAISGFCGVARYPLKTFAVITFLGAFIRAFVLGIIGWYVGVAYIIYSETVSKTEKYIFIALIILAMLLIGRFYFLKKVKTK
jgi:membrane protein DedA with SNARE-associated domain